MTDHVDELEFVMREDHSFPSPTRTEEETPSGSAPAPQLEPSTYRSPLLFNGKASLQPLSPTIFSDPDLHDPSERFDNEACGGDFLWMPPASPLSSANDNAHQW